MKKTPLEIAHDILIKNGYLPSPSQETTVSTPAVVVVSMENNGTGTREAIERVDAKGPNNTNISSSLQPLTTEQLQRIEARRQEALARRRRIQPTRPVVIRSDRADQGLQSVVVPIQEHHFSPSKASTRTSSTPIGQSNSITHRVVTPEKTENPLTTYKVVETKHVRPQCFWDDLEAAAEIVQWENEQMAEVALEQFPATTTPNFDQEFGTMQHQVRQPTEAEISNTRPSAVVSLSQELLAAAEIIQWEKEHEMSPKASGTLYDRSNFYGDEPTYASSFLNTQLLTNKVTAPVAIMSSRLHNFNCCLCISPTIARVSSKTKNFLRRRALMTTSCRTTSLNEARPSQSQMLTASAL